MANKYRKYYLRRSLLVIFLFALFISIIERSIAGNQNNECEQIIEDVESYYERIKTIECKYKKTMFSGENSESVVTKALYKKPSKIKIYNIEPIEVLYISDGNYALIYNKKENLAERIKMDETIDQIAGVESLLLINPFSGMKNGYIFKRIEDFDNYIILEATPIIKSERISRVLVKIDPVDKKALTYEIFDRNDKLLSQTKFSDYRESGDNIAYPYHIETKFLIEGKLIKEVIYFERVFLNKDIADSALEFPLPEDVNLIDRTAEN